MTRTFVLGSLFFFLFPACASRAVHKPLPLTTQADRVTYSESLKHINLCRVFSHPAKDVFTACNQAGRSQLKYTAAVNYGEPMVVVVHEDDRIKRAQRVERYKTISRGRERFRQLSSAMTGAFGDPRNDIGASRQHEHAVSRVAWFEAGNGARVISLIDDGIRDVQVVEEFFPVALK